MEHREQLDFTDFGKIIWRYRKVFLLTGLTTGILGLIIAFLLPVYFQSTATVFPAKIGYVESTDLIYRQGNINEFGDTEQAEQLLELFSSRDFQNKIIQKTSLYQHYGIDSAAAGAQYEIYQRYRQRITANRSRYNAVKISVEDQAPEKAAEIVNVIVGELDKFRNEVIGKRVKSHIRSLERSRDSVFADWKMWTDSLQLLQDRGVVSKEERAALLESVGNVRGSAPEVQQRIEANLQYGTRFDQAETEVEFLTHQLNTMDKILIQWRANISEGISQQFVFQQGHVPDKKHSPKRLLVLLATVGMGMVLMLVYLYGRENWRKIRERLEA